MQREVYEKHLQDGNNYNSWRGLKAADVAKRIESNYTTDLRYYSFDKTECTTCAHNTNNLLLFADGGCGHCANRTCLAEMNASFLMERAVQIIQQQPNVSLCRDRYSTNETVIERLTALGYEVENLERYTAFPVSPQEPKEENFRRNHRLRQDRETGDYFLLCGERSRSGRNAHRNHPFTRSEVGEAGRTQQGDSHRKDG